MGKRARAKGIKPPHKPKPMKLVPAHDPILHGVALEEVPHEDWWELGQRLVATARHHRGLAVAAPQVGVNIRLLGLHTGLVILNPSLTVRAGRQVGKEGCLSYPNRWWMVERYNRVGVVGIDPRTGEGVGELVDEGLMARLWQHEIDHLDGLVLDGRFLEVIEEE